MAITVNWSITDMTHVDSDGGVIKAYWSCVANSDGDPSYSAQNQGKIICTYDASAPGYIPYADLTENDVLGWVWDSMATDDVTAAEAKAAQEANVTARVQNEVDAAATTASGVPLVMLAELAAFNAAYGVVKEFIGNGRDLADCFGPIGQMVGAKEDLKLRQEKNKKSLFASDAEEFMALEQIKKAEEELKDFMVYFGRAGLWDDFIIFQAKARKARLEAKNAHIQKINQRVHYAGLAVGCVIVAVGLYACATIIFAIVR